jgi:hypothetical protein
MFAMQRGLSSVGKSILGKMGWNAAVKQAAEADSETSPLMTLAECQAAKVRKSDEQRPVYGYGRVDQAAQINLALTYRDLARRKAPLPELTETEFSGFSQNGEDGVLLFLFNVIGTTNRKAIEICAGDCIECNSTNLIVNHGWDGLLCDGSAANIARGKKYYAGRLDALQFVPPRMVQSWITRSTVNDLIKSNGFAGEVDLMSIDIDGMDYYIWKAIDVVRPRVVVAEYSAAAGERSWTIPYQDDYCWDLKEAAGASLPALEKLGREKGYRLIGSLRHGINAFFLRDDVGTEFFPTVTASQCRIGQGYLLNPDRFKRWIEI